MLLLLSCCTSIFKLQVLGAMASLMLDFKLCIPIGNFTERFCIAVINDMAITEIPQDTSTFADSELDIMLTEYFTLFMKMIQM